VTATSGDEKRLLTVGLPTRPAADKPASDRAGRDGEARRRPQAQRGGRGRGGRAAGGADAPASREARRQSSRNSGIHEVKPAPEDDAEEIEISVEVERKTSGGRAGGRRDELEVEWR